jgi:hypothetical protein
LAFAISAKEVIADPAMDGQSLGTTVPSTPIAPLRVLTPVSMAEALAALSVTIVSSL